MSAFIISDTQLNVIVSSMLQTKLISLSQVDKTKAMLLRANVKAVNTRYSEKRNYKPEPWQAVEYSYSQVIKFCQCYQYQCAEYDNYRNARSYKLVDKLIDTLARKIVMQAQTYESLLWAI